MQITINTEMPLTETEEKILTLLLGGSAITTESAAPVAAAKKPAKKVVEPEPEEEDEDLVGGDAEDEDEGPTMEDAVRIATELVSSKQAPKVKAALADAGVKRVSDLKPKDIAGFVNALS